MTAHQVFDAVRANVQISYESSFWGQTHEQYFIGYVRHDSFTATRATSIKNYSAPTLEGVITSTVTGSKVEVELDYTSTQKWIIVGVLGICVVMLFLPWFLIPNDDAGAFIYEPIIVLFGMLIVFYASFAIEYIVARNKLVRIVKGQLREKVR